MTKIDELLDIMDKYRNLDPPGSGDPFPKDVVARYALEALPELRSLRWIPVEERLPEDEREVEIIHRRRWDDKPLRRHGFLSTEITLKETGERLWQEAVSGHILHSTGGRVTHWREITPGPGVES